MNNLIEKKLEILKLAINQPKLYLKLYFDDLKNQIDIQCESTLAIAKCLNISENELYKVIENQLIFIQEIESFQSFCLSNIQGAYIFNFMFIEKNIESIESKIQKTEIKNLFQQKVILKIIETNLSYIENKLFCNKTFIYLNNSKLNNLNNFYIRTNTVKNDLSIGIIVCVQDEYLNKNFIK